MKTAKFKYKCRHCGAVYVEGATGEQNAMHFIFCAMYGYEWPKQFIGSELTMTALHKCEGEIQYGVADLIGYVIED